MSSGKVLLGVLAGFAAGAILGVLFAPDKGSVTRKKITKKGEDYTEKVKDKFNEFIESISEKFEKVMEEVSDIDQQKKGGPDTAEKEAKTAGS